jgi:hypothetical protein
MSIYKVANLPNSVIQPESFGFFIVKIHCPTYPLSAVKEK